jgi:hypothetical protein
LSPFSRSNDEGCLTIKLTPFSNSLQGQALAISGDCGFTLPGDGLV